MQRSLLLPFATALGLSVSSCVVPGPGSPASGYRSSWTAHDRPWIGPEVWANRFQDWRLSGGRAECIGAALPYRTLHLTTWRAVGQGAALRTRVRLGALGGGVDRAAIAGLLVGAGAADLDGRAASLVQSAPGPDGGFLVGIDGGGSLFVRDFAVSDGELDDRSRVAVPVSVEHFGGVELECRVAVSAGLASVTAAAYGADGVQIAAVAMGNLEAQRVRGNLALVSHAGPAHRDGFWFRDWRAEGGMLAHTPDLAVGPVVSSLYTVSRGVLKVTAQLMPVAPEDGTRALLEVLRQERWMEIASAKVLAPGYTATFRVDGWTAAADVPYRVVFPMREPGGPRIERHHWRGTVRREPARADPVILAAFSCCHQVRHGLGREGYPWNREALWFPHADLVAAAQRRAPDILFFAGDQIYEGASPTRADRENAELDYLYKWVLWCWAFRDLTAHLPTVVLPDDHDVFQGNLWGAGGRPARRDHFGGYVMPADWVRMVERTQVSHLPDAFDPTPIEQDIGVCYTSLRWGGIDFAVLEDRKWKSGPAGLVPNDGAPRPDHIVDASFDPKDADVAGAQLLGERQLRFLDAWARDWDGVRMKAVLSQTVFAGVATDHSSEGRLVADLDCNGWPQSGRNAALAAIRRAFAPMVCGDQHLATVVQHGIDAHRDAGVSFCVPAIANFYPRAWRPLEPGGNRAVGAPDYTGDHLDGLGNRITVLAAANPEPSERQPKALHGGMPGFGVVVFDKAADAVVFECWPRWAVPGRDRQYRGWPVTVPVRQHYGREPVAWLPVLELAGSGEPVVMVEDAAGELVYARRVREKTFQPGVFAPGRYRVTVGEPGAGRVAVLELEAKTEQEERVVVRW